MKRLLALIALLSFIGIAAVAQSGGEDSDNGFLARTLESQLSGPGRQVRLSGVSGLLSSRARIDTILDSWNAGVRAPL